MAAGLVLDAALRWVIDAVFNLDDIGEVESHQLISLCSIFTPLEDIFVSTAADEVYNALNTLMLILSIDAQSSNVLPLMAEVPIPLGIARIVNG